MAEKFIDPFNNDWINDMPRKFIDPFDNEWNIINSEKPPYIFHINKTETGFYYTVHLYLVQYTTNGNPFCLIELETDTKPKQMYTAEAYINFYEINRTISNLIEQIYTPLDDITELITEMKA